MIEALLVTTSLLGSTAHANSSVYAHCTGGGLTLEVGLGPGQGGTDLAQLTVDDGKGRVVAYEGVAGHGKIEKMLQVGLPFVGTTEKDQSGLLKLNGQKATWTTKAGARKLACELP